MYVQQECKKPLTLYSAQQPHNMVRIGAQWFLTRKEKVLKTGGDILVQKICYLASYSFETSKFRTDNRVFVRVITYTRARLYDHAPIRKSTIRIFSFISCRVKLLIMDAKIPQLRLIRSMLGL